MEQGAQQTHLSSFKLPKHEIPIFDGNKLKWTEFWDIFKVTIDQNLYLSGIEKLSYLKSRLTGEAKQAISGILMSNENYTVATTLLKDRFENIQFLLHYHYMSMINLCPATNNSKRLRFLYDQLENHFRNLESLGQDTTHGVFIPIITSKIPPPVLLQLELQKGSKNKWTVSRMRELLNNYICAMERADQQSCFGKTECKNELPMRLFTENSTSPLSQNGIRLSVALCRYCHRNHWSDQCVEFQTIEARKQKIKSSCFLCLKEGHIAHRCFLDKTCFYCGRSNHHHRSLCPKKFKLEENESDQRETQQIRYCHTSHTKQKPESEGFRKAEQELISNQMEQLPSYKQQNDVEKEHMQHHLDQLKLEMSESKTMIREIKDKLIELDTVHAKKKLITDSGVTGDKNKETVCTKVSTSSFVDSDRKVKHEKLQYEMKTQHQRDLVIDMHDLNDELSRKNVELQSMNEKLNNEVLSMTKEILTLQMENKDIETQLKDISASLANKQKLTALGNDLWNTKLAGQNMLVEDLMRQSEVKSDKDTALQEKQEINTIKQMTPSLEEQKALKLSYNEKLYDFRAKVAMDEKLPAYCKSHIHRKLVKYRKTNDISWLWECRGIPRF